MKRFYNAGCGMLKLTVPEAEDYEGGKENEHRRTCPNHGKMVRFFKVVILIALCLLVPIPAVFHSDIRHVAEDPPDRLPEGGFRVNPPARPQRRKAFIHALV